MNKEEIEVGEYVRTKNGTIKRCLKTTYDFEDNLYCNEFITVEPFVISDNIKIHRCIAKKEIVKYSKNIIDLIEVGDYVNGYKVAGVSDNGGTSEKEIMIEIPYEETYNQHSLNEEIRNIVTKEQFNNISYKVGDKE